MDNLVTISKHELNSILNKHEMWLLNDPKGERADLMRADLYGANLVLADLRWANLREANLYKADLSGADLRGADLIEANLSRAVIYEADLGRAKLDWPLVCQEKGSFIGYKKCRNNLIVELEIPEDAYRCSATSKKCRCSKAKVLSITNLDGSESKSDVAVSKYDSSFVYRIGETVEVTDFDQNRWNECSTGIHFFMNREDAVKYVY